MERINGEEGGCEKESADKFIDSSPAVRVCFCDACDGRNRDVESLLGVIFGEEAEESGKKIAEKIKGNERL